MTRVVILLFLGSSPDAHEADLEAWARARLIEIRAPEADASGALDYPADAAARIEEHLEAARLLFATLDDAGARGRLAAAERLLREHPALPQAAWLLAERLEIEADAAERAADTARAAALRRRARSLEGARAPSFSPGDGSASPPEPLVTLPLRVTGLSPGDRLYWDANPTPRTLRAAIGEHHARVVRRGRAVWAGWVTVAPNDRSVALAVPRPAPCSLDDLSSARIVADRVIARAGTRCESWAIARPAPAGGVEIATCHAAHCGPLIEWKKSYGAIYDGPPQPRAKAGLPTWATVALVGVGAAVVGGVIAWRAGAFDEPAPAGTSFRFYGP